MFDRESLKRLHADHAEKSKKLYLDNRDPLAGADDWNFALREARHVLAEALRASDYLRDIEAALEKDGAHMLAFRHFMAPPISQDQFKLLCPTWPKTSEKGSPVRPEPAADMAQIFFVWRHRFLTRWVDGARLPTRAEVRQAFHALSPLIASQRLATARRNRLAAQQENAVVELLESRGWRRLPSSLIDTRAAVPGKCFQHKTRFATATSRPQEVDMACGLGKTVVLAMECKVTNDETNSVKRINDVLKKAEAWKTHWGSFVVTAALLDGVISYKDVERLIDNDVQVFWSHDLASFASWLDLHLGEK